MYEMICQLWFGKIWIYIYQDISVSISLERNISSWLHKIIINHISQVFVCIGKNANNYYDIVYTHGCIVYTPWGKSYLNEKEN